jgi:hypothetical protein
MNQHFSNDFVGNVAQADGSEFFVSGWGVSFWDESNERIRDLRVKVTSLEG